MTSWYTPTVCRARACHSSCVRRDTAVLYCGTPAYNFNRRNPWLYDTGPRPRIRRVHAASLCGQRLLADTAIVAAMLTDLMPKNGRHDLQPAARIRDPNARLIQAQVLTHTENPKPFIVHTDASDGGVGATLSQLDADLPSASRPIQQVYPGITGWMPRSQSSPTPGVSRTKPDLLHGTFPVTSPSERSL